MANYASGLMNKFLAGKTIQRPYNYYVVIENTNPYTGKKSIFKGSQSILNMFEDVVNFPIEPWHIKSVTMPAPQTKFEMYSVGSMVKKHPMFDFESMILKVDFMEDETQIIQKFLMWMSKRRMNAYGEYYPLSESACIDIIVLVTDNTGKDIVEHRFKKCSLANATELNYTYDSSEPINISVDFSFDSVDSRYLTGDE
jgi:hypothetical protein